MPTPDVSAYTDLTLYDRTPADLVDRALTDATVKLPEWVPRDGHTEVVLMEAIALEVAELVFAVNRLPGAVVDVLLQLYGVTRLTGAPPTATVRFTLSDTLGHELPAGTAVRLTLADGTVLTFTTDAAVVAAAGAATVDAPVTGNSSTAAANGIAAGAALELASAIPYVDAVALASSIAGGTDPEDDPSWQARGVATFRRLTSSLVLPEHFTLEALDNAAVVRATTIDDYNPASGNPPGSDGGHVTVAVLGAAGAVLSSGAKAALAASMSAKAAANLAVHVVDPTLTTVDVTVTVHKVTGYVDADVQAAVAAAVRGYLSTDAWAWAAVVRRTELVALVDNVPGVDYVAAVTLPAADVALTGVAPLAVAGSVVVSLT